MNSWTSIGPYGTFGIVSALAFAPGRPQTIYVGTSGHGISRSDDGGSTWIEVNNGLTSLSVGALVIHPNDSTTVYAAAFLGVFKTTNGGSSWTAVNGGLSGLMGPLAMDPLRPDTLYAGTSSGVFKTADGGENWTPVSEGLEGTFMSVNSLAIDPISPATLYCALSRGGVYKTTNGGARWNPINVGLPLVNDGQATTLVGSIVIDPIAPSTVYAGTYLGLFKSVDGGGRWTLMNLPATGTGAYPRVLTLAIAPTAPETLYAGLIGSRLYKTTDGGMSWSSVSLPVSQGYDIRILATAPTDPTIVYAGAFFGLFRSSDGGTSWRASVAFKSLAVTSLALDPTAPSTLYAGTNSGVFKSLDAGVSWSAINNGLTENAVPDRAIDPRAAVSALVLDPRSPSTLYAGTRGGAFKSTDAGQSWSVFLPNLSVTALAVHPLLPGVVYVATEGDGIFETRHFTTVEVQERNRGLASLNVYALAVDPVSPSTIYAGALGGILKSTDGGASWATAYARDQYRFTSVMLDSSSTILAGMLYVGVSVLRPPVGGLVRSMDAAASWVDSNEGLPGPPSAPPAVWTLLADPRSPSTFYAGTETSVYRSTNSGATWTAAGERLSRSVLALALGPTRPARLYAGTAGGSAYEMTLAGPGDACLSGPTTLCLNANRFRTEVAWRALNMGRSGAGQAVPLTPETGYVWFFDPSNIELVVKILDGRALNGRFWLFYAALSNVEYTITVTDTQTGAVKTYFNPQGTLASVADTSAF